MSDVAELFDRYLAQHHAGEAPDLFDYCRQAGPDADRLALMIEVALFSTGPDIPSPTGAREIQEAIQLVDPPGEAEFRARGAVRERAPSRADRLLARLSLPGIPAAAFSRLPRAVQLRLVQARMRAEQLQ